MIKGSNHQEYILILSVCASDNRALKHMRQKLRKLNKEIDKPTTGNFNCLLSVIVTLMRKEKKRLNVNEQSGQHQAVPYTCN